MFLLLLFFPKLFFIINNLSYEYLKSTKPWTLNLLNFKINLILWFLLLYHILSNLLFCTKDNFPNYNFPIEIVYYLQIILSLIELRLFVFLINILALHLRWFSTKKKKLFNLGNSVQIQQLCQFYCRQLNKAFYY